MKILLLTYFFDPCNYVGANRVNSLYKYWRRHGHQVTVVCRHWNGRERGWPELTAPTSNSRIQQDHGGEIHYRPWSLPASSPFLPSKLGVLKNWLLGHFSWEQDCSQFESYLIDEIGLSDFDLIVASSPPHNLASLLYRLAPRAPQAKIVWDVRDFLNDVVLGTEPPPPLSSKVQYRALLKYLKRWSTRMHRVTCVVPAFVQLFEKHLDTQVVLVCNGFDEELCRSVRELEPTPASGFTLCHLGTVYPEHEYQTFITAFQQLLERHPESDIRLQCPGLEHIPAVAAEFRRQLGDRVETSGRISKVQALEMGYRSQLLVCFYRNPGCYPVKVFDYLGLHRPILVTPARNPLVRELLHSTQAGRATETVEETLGALEGWVSEFESSGNTLFRGEISEIDKWTQEQRALELIEGL